jgi:hypothetical protein
MVRRNLISPLRGGTFNGSCRSVGLFPELGYFLFFSVCLLASCSVERTAILMMVSVYPSCFYLFGFLPLDVNPLPCVAMVLLPLPPFCFFVSSHL